MGSICTVGTGVRSGSRSSLEMAGGVADVDEKEPSRDITPERAIGD